MTAFMFREGISLYRVADPFRRAAARKGPIMSKQIPSAIAASVLALAMALAAPVAVGDAGDAQTAFDQGNTAFRNGDYSSALALYGDALARGKESARLYYNMGLAHLRLGQYPQARSAFMQSAQDPDLAALSYYQLGILAHEDGDSSSAEAWFERSASDAESSRLREKSLDALASIGSPRGELTSSISAGFGHDSNAFRAPRDSYIDYSADTPVPVDPIEQSGSYVPIRVGADYIRPVSKRSAWIAAYRHRGDYYTDKGLDNANVTDHQVSLGLKRYFDNSRSRARQIELNGFVRSHGETNFDRDDGLDRFDDGSSIADRFDYVGTGLELDLRNRAGRLRYEIEAGFSQRNYDDLPTTSSYDLQSHWAGASLKFPLATGSRLEFGYTHYVRSFDERRARDLTGDASSANPTLEYRYGMLEAGIRHRFSDLVVSELVYSFTARSDEFLGYNDYERDRIRLDTTIDVSDRLAARLRIDYRDQQYPNAFAFDDPTQPSKEYQDLELSARLLYQITSQLSLRANVEQEAVDSSDPRGAYDRLRTDLGLIWSF